MDGGVSSNHVPFRILSQRIRSITETTLPVDLQRLKQHRENIRGFQKSKDWERLNAEEINASRTAQNLKRHLESLDELRDQISPDEVDQFDSRVRPLKQEIVEAIEEYGSIESTGPPPDSHSLENFEFDELSIEEQSLLVPAQEPASHSWEELRNELVGLNEMVQALSSHVRRQGEGVQRLEEEVGVAQTLVQEGTGELAKASTYKSYMLPVGGAFLGGVLGGIIGGPIGLLGGLKVGILTGTAGGTVGAVGGAYMGYRGGARPLRDREQEMDKKTR